MSKPEITNLEDAARAIRNMVPGVVREVMANPATEGVQQRVRQVRAAVIAQLNLDALTEDQREAASFLTMLCAGQETEKEAARRRRNAMEYLAERAREHGATWDQIAVATGLDIDIIAKSEFDPKTRAEAAQRWKRQSEMREEARVAKRAEMWKQSRRKKAHLEKEPDSRR